MIEMASSNTNENGAQSRTCRCGEGDTNIWTTRTSSDNPDKQSQKCAYCQMVLKSGPLFLSSKGIGWTSWKKRWFILTRTSLVFYRSDPNSTTQKGSEANLTLGGLDLNNSGSVVAKADKKLLTVLFPDGRTLTLKAETLEDLFEWKAALENALAQSPCPAHTMGQNGIFRNDVPDAVEASFEQWKDRKPVKSLVVGRPILHALEDIDGSPSFLEKALQYIERHGINVEGILRQSADVEEVESRVREYEQGKMDFSSDEDAHVVGDCIKHILRELPSSPVPATSCTALVEAYRTDRGSRINAMRAAVAETFPEPNRRLVQRILKMMLTVASHKSENRMTLSAVAACMAPLLLRPLLAGDCELEDDFNMGGDGSIQLLQAAAAANHAQAIVIILLEEYERIFDEDSFSSDLYSDTEDDEVEDESTDDDMLEDDEYNDGEIGLEADIEDDPECSYSGTLSECNSEDGSDFYHNQAYDNQNSEPSSPTNSEDVEVAETPSDTTHALVLQQVSSDTLVPLQNVQKVAIPATENSNSYVELNNDSHEVLSDHHAPKSPMDRSDSHTSPSSITKHTGKSNEPLPSKEQSTTRGKTSARKKLPLDSKGYSSEDEIAIQRLKIAKSDLQTEIAKEVKENAILQENLEKRKEELHERQLNLERDVKRLCEQLQKERSLRASLEAVMMNTQPGQLLSTPYMDSKTRADIEEITLAETNIINLNEKAADLRGRLSHELYTSLCESCRHLYAMHQSTKKEQQNDIDSATYLDQNEDPSNRENAAFQADHEDLKTQIPDNPPSSSNRQKHTKQHMDTTIQDSGHLLGPSNTPYAEKTRTVAYNAAPKKPFSRDENSITTYCDNMRCHAQGSPSSPDKQLLDKLQPDITNQSSQKNSGSDRFPSIEPKKLGHTKSTKSSSPRGETVREHVSQNSTKSTEFTSSSHSEPNTFAHGVAPKMSGSRNENSMVEVGCGNMKSQTENLPSSPNKQTPKHFQSKTAKESSKSLGSNIISAAEEPTVGCNNALKKSSIRGDAGRKEDALPSASYSEEQKTIGCDAGLRKFTSREEEDTFSDSMASYVEEPTTVSQDVTLKKLTSRDEDSMLGTDSKNMRIQTQNLPSSPDKQSSQMVQVNPTYDSSTRSQGSSSLSSTEEPATYDRSAASKKPSLSGTVTKDLQDAQSLPNRQSPRKQWHNTTVNSTKALGPGSLSSSEGAATVSRSFASRRSSLRVEETATSTSALTKLTNRLNFLKERRVQLVNELQNLGAPHALDPEGPPPKGSPS